METARRTLVKALLWNLLGLSVMAGVGFAATGSLALGGSMAVVNAALGFLTYLIYERIWTRIAWGRV
ncbi:MAG: DUF2061 domain-containing protein [Rhodobacter sp.]|nr:DUF2061 domain-containing protein [Rhodobacter sp.]